MNKVKEADPQVPRSPNVIEKTHILLQRAAKRMEKMEGLWDDFSSWQAVNEMVFRPPRGSSPPETFQNALMIPSEQESLQTNCCHPFLWWFAVSLSF
jgi:hypothetical protein